MLKEFDKTLIDVEGHTDSDGSDKYNQQLSLQRATSVGSYLQSHGVNGQRIVTLVPARARPIANNDNADGKQQNRRVELKLSRSPQADFRQQIRGRWTLRGVFLSALFLWRVLGFHA